MDHYVIN